MVGGLVDEIARSVVKPIPSYIGLVVVFGVVWPFLREGLYSGLGLGLLGL